MCLNKPADTIMGLTVLFIVLFFVTGVMDITFAVINKDILPGWGWTLAMGILDVLFGVILLSMPAAVITVIMIYMIGFWILFRAIWTIGVASDLMKVMNARGLLAIGILTLIFALFYLLSPVFNNAIVVVALVAFAFIAYGCFRIYLAFRLKSVHKNIDKFAEKIEDIQDKIEDKFEHIKDKIEDQIDKRFDN